jgi:hypothetical protein
MSDQINKMLSEDPRKWIEALPKYQKTNFVQLLDEGLSYDEVAERWCTATAANTFRLGAAPGPGKSNFLEQVKIEIRACLCGDARYAKERESLFGEKSATRTFVVGGLAVAIAPHLGVAAPVLAPMITLVLASIGGITINAWCTATAPAKSDDA